MRALLVGWALVGAAACGEPFELVSESLSGGPADAASAGSVVSPDGRFVAFVSVASDLVPGVSGGPHLYLRDLRLGTTTLVGRDLDGVPVEARRPGISRDGERVVFESEASRLVPGDDNGAADVFFWERAGGTVRRISELPDGTGGDRASGEPSISADGRFVVFASLAGNLEEGVVLSPGQLYVHDVETGTTTAPLRSASGARFSGDLRDPRVSANGRFVAFTARASNLPDNTTFWGDLYLFDRDPETVRLVAHGAGGFNEFRIPRLAEPSDDGSRVAFLMDYDCVGGVPGFPYECQDLWRHEVHVWDAGTDTHAPVGRDVAVEGLRSEMPSMSADGRRVAFASEDPRVTYDVNGSFDVFLWDTQSETTHIVSRAPNGAAASGESHAPDLSADGAWLSFSSDATDYLPPGGGVPAQVFRADLDRVLD